MRHVDRIPSGDLKVDPKQLGALTEFLTQEVEDASAARTMQEGVWREALRLYEGVPKNPVRNVPIENAPNIEVTLAAIAADAIYAQAVDLIYTASPILTVRPTRGKWTDHGKALQTFVNWGIGSEWGLRSASEHAILDDVQLGTGVYTIPFVETVKKTKAYSVQSRAPHIFKLPVEDFFVPGGADADLQTTTWCGGRFWYTKGELEDRARRGGWNVGGVAPVGAVGWVRSQREALGRTNSSRKVTELYEIFNLYAYFDIDGDGADEDILAIWDRTSRSVLKLRYNPFDHRPFEAMRYQLRGHLFYGIGAVEMMRAFQEGVTEFYNQWVTNALLANARIWKARRGSVPDNMRLWPNRVIQLSDPDDLKPEQMGDVYQSLPQAIAVTISLAERRVGVNEMSLPRPSQVLGSRTPGITALSLLQMVNRRFTPAFDAMRMATAGAVRQCLYRYQERLLAGDQQVEEHIKAVLGDEEGSLVVGVLKSDEFDEAVAIELTASSASVNRDADRQNAVMLIQMLGNYYERILQLTVIASNPQVPPAVKEVAIKIATAGGEAIDRAIRTFDSMRDPRTFVISMEEALDRDLAGVSQSGLSGLTALLGSLGGGAGGGNGAGTPL